MKIGIFTAFIFGLFLRTNAQNHKHDIFVPNSKTAIKIAEAIWEPIYGNSIYSKQPFIASLIGDTIWTVRGTLPKGRKGGVPYIEIRKDNSTIIKVTHGK